MRENRLVFTLQVTFNILHKWFSVQFIFFNDRYFRFYQIQFTTGEKGAFSFARIIIS